jgi:hypothetical protein
MLNWSRLLPELRWLVCGLATECSWLVAKWGATGMGLRFEAIGAKGECGMEAWGEASFDPPRRAAVREEARRGLDGTRRAGFDGSSSQSTPSLDLWCVGD